jgi:hypothetical protein
MIEIAARINPISYEKPLLKRLTCCFYYVYAKNIFLRSKVMVEIHFLSQ